MKKSFYAICLAAVLFFFPSCEKEKTPYEEESKEEEEETSNETQYTNYYVNYFAYNLFDLYYLWVDEMSSEMDAWASNPLQDPSEAVKSVRYEDKSTGIQDLWSQIIPDYEAFTSSVDGVSTTCAYDFTLMYFDAAKTRVCAVVTYVVPGGPADKAGLKRGSTIVKVNGEVMTPDNYVDVVNDVMLGGSSYSVDLYGGSGAISMTPVEMYEEPVMLTRTFDVSGKKVGYMVYNSFTLESCETLLAATDSLKRSGISELILDLRYNGGGYVITEELLASILAPSADVTAGKVFEKEVYNSTLAEAFADDVETKFKTSYSFTSGGVTHLYNTSTHNLGLSKLHAIISYSSASASESLLVGLMPYMDVTLYGQTSYGKYCSGIMYGAEEWYTDYKKYLSSGIYSGALKYADNWGAYVMVSRYTDCNGECPCMPDGLTPDVEVEDNPLDGYQLGDSSETMLAAVLERIGGSSVRSSMEGASLPLTPYQHKRPAFGLRLLPTPCLQ